MAKIVLNRLYFLGIINNFIMGAIQSKKYKDIKFDLHLNLSLQVKAELKQLTDWSLQQVRELYSTYCRLSDSPYISKFIFSKMVPFIKQTSKILFEKFSGGQKYLCIYDLLCALILTSYTTYKHKMQFVMKIFDYQHKEYLLLQDLVFIYQSFIYAYCRLNGCQIPAYRDIKNYTYEYFLRSNAEEVLNKKVNLRKLIEQIESSQKITTLFQKYEQIQFKFIKENYLIFSCLGLKKFTREEINKIYRIISKAKQDENYEEVELYEKNKMFRLENRRILCLKARMEEKQEQIHSYFGKKNTQPKLHQRNYSQFKLDPIPKNLYNTTQNQKLIPSSQHKVSNNESKKAKNIAKKSKNKLIFLKGQTISKKDIFETINYFKTLSNNNDEIKLKQFYKTFEKKNYLKKQLSSLFQYFDTNHKGQVTFNQFLRVIYKGLNRSDIQMINEWYDSYKDIYESDFPNLEYRRSLKKNANELPKQAHYRIQDIFNSMDFNAKGYLTFDDMRKAYQTGYSMQELQSLIREYGENNKIYLQGFKRLLIPQGWIIEPDIKKV